MSFGGFDLGFAAEPGTDVQAKLAGCRVAADRLSNRINATIARQLGDLASQTEAIARGADGKIARTLQRARDVRDALLDKVDATIAGQMAGVIETAAPYITDWDALDAAFTGNVPQSEPIAASEAAGGQQAPQAAPQGAQQPFGLIPNAGCYKPWPVGGGWTLEQVSPPGSCGINAYKVPLVSSGPWVCWEYQGEKKTGPSATPNPLGWSISPMPPQGAVLVAVGPTQASLGQECNQPEPVRYNCVMAPSKLGLPPTASCVPSATGTYATKADCEAACLKPPQRYRCENGQCVADPNGPYFDLTECEQACQPKTCPPPCPTVELTTELGTCQKPMIMAYCPPGAPQSMQESGANAPAPVQADFSTPDVCKQLPNAQVGGDNVNRIFSWLVGGCLFDGTETANLKVLNFIFGGSLFGQFVSDILRGLGVQIDSIFDNIVAKFTGNNVDDLKIVQQRALYGVLNVFFGHALDAKVQELTYLRDFRRPYLVPGIGEAVEGYLTDVWPGATEPEKADQLACLSRINGYHADWQERLAYGRRYKFTPAEYAALFRRLGWTPDQLRARMRAIGSLLPSDDAELLKLTEQLPFQSDIIRMMVRDADDPAAVQRNDLDKDFAAKFGGQLRQWAEQQGVSEKAMLYNWRAHWQLPSPGQLYEMFHRLRWPDVPQDIRVDETLIKQTLEQQDIAPAWIDRFLAVSFRLPPQRLLQRSLDAGLMPEDKAKRQFQELGFSDENADTFVKLGNITARARAVSNQWSRLYERGLVGRTAARNAMLADGISEANADYALDRGFRVLQTASRNACEKALRKRFLQMEIDAATATTALDQLGLDADQAQAIVAGWQCELSTRGRDLTASTLCTLFDQGLILAPEFLNRLVRAGWAPADAKLLVESCGIKLTKREARDAERQARITKQQTDRAARMARARVRAEMRRKKAYLGAGLALARKLGVPAEDTIQPIEDARLSLRALGRYDADAIMEIIVKAVAAFDGDDVSQFQAAVDVERAAYDDFSEPEPSSPLDTL